MIHANQNPHTPPRGPTPAVKTTAVRCQLCGDPIDPKRARAWLRMKDGSLKPLCEVGCDIRDAIRLVEVAK